MKYLVFLLIFSGCASTQKGPPTKGYFSHNVLNQPLHHKSLPVSLSLDHSVPKELVPLFHQAARTINQELKVTALLINPEPIQADFNHRHRDHQNVIFWGQPKNFMEQDFPHEQAKTICFGGGDQLDECDIRFNPTSHQNFKKLDLDTLIRHELYHVLGLVHHNNSNHIMSEHLQEYSKKLGLDPKSIEMFYQVYKISQP